jgi:hypothetical protein
MPDQIKMPAISIPGRIEPQASVQEYLKKIATVPTDMEGAVEAVLKMYEVTLDDKEMTELSVLLMSLTYATTTLYLSEVIHAFEEPPMLEDHLAATDAAVALGERIHTRYGLLLRLVQDDGVSTGRFNDQPRSLLQQPFSFSPSSTSVEFALPTMAEHVREYPFAHLSSRPKLPRDPTIRGERSETNGDGGVTMKRVLKRQPRRSKEGTVPR